MVWTESKLDRSQPHAFFELLEKNGRHVQVCCLLLVLGGWAVDITSHLVPDPSSDVKLPCQEPPSSEFTAIKKTKNKKMVGLLASRFTSFITYLFLGAVCFIK